MIGIEEAGRRARGIEAAGDGPFRMRPEEVALRQLDPKGEIGASLKRRVPCLEVTKATCTKRRERAIILLSSAFPAAPWHTPESVKLMVHVPSGTILDADGMGDEGDSGSISIISAGRVRREMSAMSMTRMDPLTTDTMRLLKSEWGHTPWLLEDLLQAPKIWKAVMRCASR